MFNQDLIRNAGAIDAVDRKPRGIDTTEDSDNYRRGNVVQLKKTTKFKRESVLTNSAISQSKEHLRFSNAHTLLRPATCDERKTRRQRRNNNMSCRKNRGFRGGASVIVND